MTNFKCQSVILKFYLPHSLRTNLEKGLGRFYKDKFYSQKWRNSNSGLEYFLSSLRDRFWQKFIFSNKSFSPLENWNFLEWKGVGKATATPKSIFFLGIGKKRLFSSFLPQSIIYFLVWQKRSWRCGMFARISDCSFVGWRYWFGNGHPADK